MSHRFGGDLFLGVLDDGTVSGVPEKAAPDMVKNFISCISNPALFSPTIYLAAEILQYEGKTMIHVHILPSAEVHSYKKVIYDRVNDADQLGSGVRNLFRYSKFYSGKKPEFIEGELESAILQLMKGMPAISQREIAARLALNLNTVKYYIRKMQKEEMIERTGSNRKGKWIVK